MSDFTDFFPAASGGGGIGKTITVGDYSYPNARDIDEWAKNKFSINNGYSEGYFIFEPFSSNNPWAYTAALQTNDTYEIIANITNATNGGALFSIGSYKTSSSQTTSTATFKITIDGGTPKEYTFIENTNGRSFGNFMGDFCIYSNESNGYGSPVPTNTRLYNANDGEELIGTHYDNSSATMFTSMTGYYAYNRACLGKAAPFSILEGTAFVYYSTSCKVEVKETNVTSCNAYAKIINF
tara:strand:- start:668 stop:1384 length:717 start_codon:yes stop_codon:yes gene_type:complete